MAPLGFNISTENSCNFPENLLEDCILPQIILALDKNFVHAPIASVALYKLRLIDAANQTKVTRKPLYSRKVTTWGVISPDSNWHAEGGNGRCTQIGNTIQTLSSFQVI
jgi:hypothetical protein